MKKGICRAQGDLLRQEAIAKQRVILVSIAKSNIVIEIIHSIIGVIVGADKDALVCLIRFDQFFPPPKQTTPFGQ